MTNVGNLYYKYGSKITTGVSEMFYDRVYDDPSLSSFFQGIEKHKMQEHFDDVLSEITGGPEQYKGRDLKVAHAAYAITADDFDILIGHLASSLEEVGVSNEDAQAIVGVVVGKRGQIIKV